MIVSRTAQALKDRPGELAAGIRFETNLVATILPSGVVRKFPLAAFFESQIGSGVGRLSTIGLDTPTTERELRHAEVLASALRVSPALAGVIEREVVPSVNRAYPDLPTGNRVVYVPVAERSPRFI